jgi:anti-sigma factor RsiW
MSLCQSIDTLAMAYLDDELAAEERRELELHLYDCPGCKAHVDGERSELDMLRKALVAPPASDILKMRIDRALDDEDRSSVIQTRKRFGALLLPASAVLVAAAAFALFFGVVLRSSSDTSHPNSALGQEALRQGHNRAQLPLEVEGNRTAGYLQQHFATSKIAPPQFDDSGIQLLGARLTEVSGHDAALVQYVVSKGDEMVTLTAVLIDRVQPDDLSGGDLVRVGNRILHVHDAYGNPAITYVDEDGLGYAFTSQRLSAEELVRLIASSDLIGRTQQGR